MIRTLFRDHLFPVMLPIITIVKTAAVVQIHQLFPVRLVHPITGSSSFQIQIRIFTVHSGHACHIFRTLHPPLQFERINPGIDQIRDQVKRANIFRTQQISLFPIRAIRKPARLRALPPVSASSADQTAHETLTGITITKRSVHKALDFHSGFFFHSAHFLQR